jgi:hypothetical protein
MKCVLATTFDDTHLGPDLADLAKEIRAMFGHWYTCNQIAGWYISISPRVFWVADRKAMSYFGGFPYNQLSITSDLLIFSRITSDFLDDTN